MGCSSIRIGKLPTVTIQEASQLVVQPSVFVTANARNFHELYELGRLLGTGSFGEVRICVHRHNRVQRAVKIFRKDSEFAGVIKQRMMRETEILKHLDHPNVVRVFESFDDEKRHYIVMEYCQGGELFDELIKRHTFTEYEAAQILKQLFSAVAYLHSHKVTHRDLKPENILLEHSGAQLRIKLVDFGTATVFSSQCCLSDAQGTPYYVAPEVLSGVYTEKCDEWGCGVILYILLSGTPPFDGRTEEDILNSVRQMGFGFPEKQWSSVSEEAKLLIRQLLTPESQRLSALEALTHPWVQIFATVTSVDSGRMSSILSSLKGFHCAGKLRDAVRTFIASQCMSAADMKELRDAFVKIDTNGDGKLSKEELLAQYRLKMSDLDAETEVRQIMAEADTDNNGFIDYIEFIKASMDTRKVMSSENLRIAFNLFDRDGDGRISANELKSVLQSGLRTSSKVWKQIVQEVDRNGDGIIDFLEFEHILLKHI